MNPAPNPSTATTLQALSRTPERWLLAGPSEAWCEGARSVLAEQAQRLPETSFLGWRLQHGLLQVVPASALDAALTLALAAPRAAGVDRNATRIWAALSESDWYAATDGNAALHAPSARGLTVSWLSTRSNPETSADLLTFLRAADAPDALPRLAWLMSERPLPVPRDWLPLAPLAERSAAQNDAMAAAGYRCYAAWAQAVLEGSDPDELRALWGPFGDDDAAHDTGTGEGEGAGAANAAGAEVIDLNERRRPPPSLAPASSRHPSTLRMSGAPLSSERLAAASAEGDSGSSFDDVPPVWTRALEPAVSRAAEWLEAFVLAPAARERPQVIEFVASWTRSNNVPAQPEDLCLVLTLPKRKPVLLKGRLQDAPSRTAKGALCSVRFAWPPERRPADAPAKAHLVGRWLAEQLQKARVSLQ